MDKVFNDPLFHLGAGLLAGDNLGQGVRQGLLSYQANRRANQLRQYEQMRMAELQRKAEQERAEMEAEEKRREAMLEAGINPDLPEWYHRAQMQGPESAPANVREWQYFSQLSAPDQERYLGMKRATQWLNTGLSHVAPSPVDPTKPIAQVAINPPPETAPDYQAAQTAAKEAAKQGVQKQGNRGKAMAAFNAFNRQSNIVLDNLDNLKKTYTPALGLAYGVGGGNIPMTKMRQMQNYLKTIKANIGFQALQEMRANSPTGGALGQVAVQELEGLQATLGALDPASPDFMQQIEAVENRTREILAGVKQAFEVDYGQSPQKGARSPVGQSTGQPKVIDFNDLP